MLNTIDRTGRVLNLFTAEAPEWGVTAVAAALGLPKSTTFDILTSLAEIGLLQQTSGDRYRLGWKLLAISRRLMSSSCFNAHTHHTITGLAKHLSATVTIGAWDGQGVVCIASGSASRTGPVPTEGTHLSGHASALGKLLMAQLSWAKVQERIDRYGLPALTANTVGDADGFRAQLSNVHQRGFAIEHGEAVIGHSCIAVGLYECERRMIAALAICTPSTTMRARQDEYVRIAQRTARTLLQHDASPKRQPPYCAT
ncbi:IclR family transcriptional regulator [Mycolicibacterium goodii]|uniref:IclR family transcriptional regulator n=1 Tax=Mycolicibacterium goodii TaxID=134601 RepID=UPI001BDD424A|nr:IclR family transcriptional regulator [Mycolicibacterium goodii]MBU8808202.1 IclR family transcriptional regulator [Mycolicibacterium goodii]